MSTKDKIVRIALKYFLREGYDATSLNTIALAVGIAKPSMYHYFSSKQDLFHEVLRYFFSEMGAWSQSHYGNCTTFHELLHCFFHSLESMQQLIRTLMECKPTEETASFFELIMSASRKDPKIKKIIAESYKNTQKNIKQKIIEAQQAGTLDPALNSEGLAYQISATIEGLMLIGFFDNYQSITNISEHILENMDHLLIRSH